MSYTGSTVMQFAAWRFAESAYFFEGAFLVKIKTVFNTQREPFLDITHGIFLSLKQQQKKLVSNLSELHPPLLKSE